MPSTGSWGIGEIADLAPMTRWLPDAGMGVLQLLPTNEMAPGQTSPYSAISADGARSHLHHHARGARLHRVRRRAAAGSRRSGVDPDGARARHASTMRACGASRSTPCGWRSASSGTPSGCAGTARAGAFAAFCAWEEWWLADYALYRALREANGGRVWMAWDEPLRRRDPQALACARGGAREGDALLPVPAVARRRAVAGRARAAAPVALFGDFPFMVGRRQRRRLGAPASVPVRRDRRLAARTRSAPPGQDWGMPVYRWDVMDAGRTTGGCASVRSAAPGCSTGTASITSSASIARSRARSTARRAASTRRTRPIRSRSASASWRVFLECGARDHRRGPRHRARLRARVARPAWAFPGTRCCAGSASGSADGQPFIDPARVPGALGGDDGHARHRPDRDVVGDGRPDRAQGVARAAGDRARFATAVAGDGAVHAGASRRAFCVLLYRRRPIWCSFRFPTCSGGPIASTRRPRSRDDNWTWRLPWPVDTLAAVRRPRARERCAGLGRRDRGGRGTLRDRGSRCTRKLIASLFTPATAPSWASPRAFCGCAGLGFGSGLREDSGRGWPRDRRTWRRSPRSSSRRRACSRS